MGVNVPLVPPGNSPTRVKLPMRVGNTFDMLWLEAAGCIPLVSAAPVQKKWNEKEMSTHYELTWE